MMTEPDRTCVRWTVQVLGATTDAPVIDQQQLGELLFERLWVELWPPGRDVLTRSLMDSYRTVCPHPDAAHVEGKVVPFVNQSYPRVRRRCRQVFLRTIWSQLRDNVCCRWSELAGGMVFATDTCAVFPFRFTLGAVCDSKNYVLDAAFHPGACIDVHCVIDVTIEDDPISPL